MVYDRYYYTLLSDKEKNIYKKVYGAVVSVLSTVEFQQADIFKVDISKIVEYIILDNPHIFYLDEKNIKIYSSLLKVDVDFTYLYSKDEIEILQQKVNAALGEIVRRVKAVSDYEKELAIHDVLVKNVLYDDYARENPNKNITYAHSILGVLLYKTAVCDGISKTVKMLLNLLEIKCIVAIGQVNGAGHAWNIVKIGGKAYHLDVTADISNSDKDDLYYGCFNIPDSELQESIRDVVYPICDSYEENYFMKSGLAVNNQQDLEKIIEKALRTNKRVVTIKDFGDLTNKAIMKCAERVGQNFESGEFSVALSSDTVRKIYTIQFSA